MLNQAVPSRFSLPALSDRFVRDDKGTIIQLFGLTLVVVCGIMGLAIDGGRAMSAHNKAGRALDSAALAAARSLMATGASDDELTQQAKEFFKSNTDQGGSLIAYYDNVRVVVDRGGKTVRVDADTRVPTYFAQVVGFKEFKFGSFATASFDLKDIELGVQLDLTGSMCWSSAVSNGINTCTSGVKLDALKAATNTLIDELMPDGRLNKVRIGFAPFSAGVDAGPYAATVSDGASTRCVMERTGGDARTDAPPSPSNPMQLAGLCPTASPVLALTDDKTMLKNTVATYKANGGTAGHLGTGWAWYLVSPNWSALWPADSEPTAYRNPNVIKAVVLMTDGDYNVYGGTGGTALSIAEAKALCDNMKAEGVKVYSVIFFPPSTASKDTMKYCASTDDNGLAYYEAEDVASLNDAFRDIAYKVNNLRIAD
jgi:Flp pilus assembly protein TadG